MLHSDKIKFGERSKLDSKQAIPYYGVVLAKKKNKNQSLVEICDWLPVQATRTPFAQPGGRMFKAVKRTELGQIIPIQGVICWFG